jgi:hypothetical protein
MTKEQYNDLYECMHDKLYLDIFVYPGGNMRLNTYEDIKLYHEDNAQFMANMYGISREDYIEWDNNKEIDISCSGITKKGKKCQCGIIKDAFNDLHDAFYDPREYLRLKDKKYYCHLHEDQVFDD